MTNSQQKKLTSKNNDKMVRNIVYETQVINLKKKIADLEKEIKEIRTECAVNRMRYNAAICEVERLRGKINGRDEDMRTL